MTKQPMMTNILRKSTSQKIHPLLDEWANVFARHIGDGFEESMSRQ